MATQEDINHQVDLLNTSRKRLHQLIKSGGTFGVHVPAHIVTEIDTAREGIARIKRNLANWSVRIEDHPDDFADQPVTTAKEVQVNISADKVMIVIPITEFGRMLAINPELLQYVVYKS